MSNIGSPITIAGVATLVETPVAIPTSFIQGMPNKDGSRPVAVFKRATMLKGEISINNRDATNALLVRFNGQAAQILVRPASERKLAFGAINQITVQAAAATVAFDILGS